MRRKPTLNAVLGQELPVEPSHRRSAVDWARTFGAGGPMSASFMSSHWASGDTKGGSKFLSGHSPCS
jgi:hypothetical protein